MNEVEVLVDLPFIMMLKDFAMASIKPLTLGSVEEQMEPAVSEDTETEDAGAMPMPATPESPDKSEPLSPAIAEPSSKSGEETVSQGKLTIGANIKKPLIALVEDAEDLDSRALVLRVSCYLCTQS